MGRNTVWRLENNVIGNAVADEVKTRKDGFVALSVHGNGLFSARFSLRTQLPESNLSVAFLLDDFVVGENAADTTIDVSGLFVQSGGLPINVTLTNSNPTLATATLNGNDLTISFAPNSLVK